MSTAAVGDLVSQPYRYGFVTDIETEKIPKGLDGMSCG
jgi:Fe-S cluster assembly protein SufB